MAPDVTLNTSTGPGAGSPGIAGSSSTLDVLNGSLINQNVSIGNDNATGGGIDAVGASSSTTAK